MSDELRAKLDSLGYRLAEAGFDCVEYTETWQAHLAWNLTIAALLCRSAERAYEQGCYDGIAPEAGYEDTYDCAYPDAARLHGPYSEPTVITFKP